MSHAGVCAHCGAAIEGKGILYRDHIFCSDDCCDEYALAFVMDDPGFDDDEVSTPGGFLDDDFEINPDDF